MAEQVTVDMATFDPSNDEFVLYVVDDGPWPNTDDGWKERLRGIQDKVLDLVDAVVDGGVAQVYADSIGKKFRLQIDSPNGCPAKLEELVRAISSYIHSTKEYGGAISSSRFTKGVRIVTGHMMGRFAS